MTFLSIEELLHKWFPNQSVINKYLIKDYQHQEVGLTSVHYDSGLPYALLKYFPAKFILTQEYALLDIRKIKIISKIIFMPLLIIVYFFLFNAIPSLLKYILLGLFIYFFFIEIIFDFLGIKSILIFDLKEVNIIIKVNKISIKGETIKSSGVEIITLKYHIPFNGLNYESIFGKHWTNLTISDK